MFDPSETSPESLKIAVQHAGFDMITDTAKDPSEISEEQFAKSYRKLKINVISAAVMSVAMFCIGMFCRITGGANTQYGFCPLSPSSHSAGGSS